MAVQKMRSYTTSLLLAAAFISQAQAIDLIVTEYPVLTSHNAPTAITAGADGNLWFTEFTPASTLNPPPPSAIGKITPNTGVITIYPLPGSSAPNGITAGPDGNLWFTDGLGHIGKITTDGVITEFSLPNANSDPRGIVAGPDGKLWFTESGAGKIGVITIDGTITEYSLSASNSAPTGITAGPDGNLWFAELGVNKIGRITTTGTITEFSVPTNNTGPAAITQGPDGNLWFTELFAGKIGMVTPDGLITEFAIPTSSSDPSAITTGPDGSVWFTEGVNNIARASIGHFYSVSLLYDPTKAVNSGSVIPIKLQLYDGSGKNVSSPGFPAHALAIRQTSTLIYSSGVQDSGSANPDSDFRFDATLGGTGGYIFNLSTKGIMQGSYNLVFTVPGDWYVYPALFQVK